MAHPHPNKPTIVRPTDERVAQIAATLTPQPQWPFGDLANRALWDRFASMASPDWMAEAEAFAAQKPPTSTRELYEVYWQNGSRTTWSAIESTYTRRLLSLALAEGFERQGRFAAPLCEQIEVLCDQLTWVAPAHDYERTNASGERITVDLSAAMTGASLAAACQLLGESLPTPVRQRLEMECENRLFAVLRGTYETGREAPWWLDADNNWNSVCLCGVTLAALSLLPDTIDRARFVAGAELHIQRFLDSFGEDGACLEGISYWNYGFSHFAFLAEALCCATGGVVDLWQRPNVAAIVRFPQRFQLVPGLYPAFSDVVPHARPSAWLWAFSYGRLGIEAHGGHDDGGWLRYQLYSGLAQLALPPANPVSVPCALARHDFFPDACWYLGRSQARGQLSLAFKGGHNGEPHNHNDLGNFIIAVGGQVIVAEIGCEIYTQRTFDERRYLSPVHNSYGHNVPLLDGTGQEFGAQFRAPVVHTFFSPGRDEVTLDLSGAYTLPALESLRRTANFERTNDTIEIRDTAQFSHAVAYETALVTFGQWQQTSPTTLVLSGVLEVAIQSDTPVEIAAETLDVNLASRLKPTRLALRCAPATQVMFSLQFRALAPIEDELSYDH